MRDDGGKRASWTKKGMDDISSRFNFKEEEKGIELEKGFQGVASSTMNVTQLMHVTGMENFFVLVVQMLNMRP